MEVKKIVRTLAFSYCLFCYACSPSNTNPIGYQGEIPCIDIQVDASDYNSQIPLSSIKNSFAVKLETNENSIFGDIRRLRVTDDKIFILDSDVAESLFVFDRNGHFLHKVGSKGNGPGEYYSINDFYIDTSRDEIIIYDGDYRRLHYYSMDGVFIRTHSFLDIWMFACCPLDSLNYALDFTNTARGKNKFHLQLVNQNNEVYFEYKPLKFDHEFAANNNIAFYSGIDKIFYTPVHSDTIFNLSRSGIESGYAIDFGKQKLPEDFFDGIDRSKHAEKLLKSNYCYGIKDVSETNRFLCFDFSYGNRGFSTFYDKETKQTYQLQFFPNPLASYNNYFVGVYEGYSVKGIDNIPKEAQNQWINAIGETNWNLLKNLKEEDNPLIVFYEIEAPV
jgi:hypothetical protein